MITVDITKVLQELQQYKEEVDRKLKYMVVQFSYLISSEAIRNTPLGNAAPKDQGGNLPWYLRREELTGLQPIAGFAQGSWQVNTSGTFNIQETYSGGEALSLIRGSVSNYQLGQTVYIGNTGYYIQQLENNYSEQTQGMGIMKPTIDAITSTYQVDLKRLFDEG